MFFGRSQREGGQKTSSYGGVCIRIYPGQYFDEETGLHYNYYRYYDAEIGRYLRTDPSNHPNAGGNLYLKPILLTLQNEANKFLYSRNNPIVLFDYYGLISCKVLFCWQRKCDGCPPTTEQCCLKYCKGLRDEMKHYPWLLRPPFDLTIHCSGCPGKSSGGTRA